MKLGDQNYFRNLLLGEKEKFLASANLSIESIKQGAQTPPDEYDFAVTEVNQFMTCKIHSRERKHLLDIEKALARIETGDFGCCESCGEPISMARLKATPFTSLCIDCMEDLELENKRFA